MADAHQVRALLERYCSAMNERRREDWLDCFADDAVQEDPVGAPQNVGREAIGAFYDANDVGVSLWLTADPLIVGREVLAFFAATADMENGRMLLPRIVDHIVLTEDGTRFQSLRAFLDFAEMRPAEG